MNLASSFIFLTASSNGGLIFTFIGGAFQGAVLGGIILVITLIERHIKKKRNSDNAIKPDQTKSNDEKAPIQKNPEKQPKKRFCKFCGAIIESETKKCSVCGKQYFKFRIPRFMRSPAWFLCTVVLCATVVFMFISSSKSYISTPKFHYQYADFFTNQSIDKFVEKNPKLDVLVYDGKIYPFYIETKNGSMYSLQDAAAMGYRFSDRFLEYYNIK